MSAIRPLIAMCKRNWTLPTTRPALEALAWTQTWRGAIFGAVLNFLLLVAGAAVIGSVILGAIGAVMLFVDTSDVGRAKQTGLLVGCPVIFVLAFVFLRVAVRLSDRLGSLAPAQSSHALLSSVARVLEASTAARAYRDEVLAARGVVLAGDLNVMWDRQRAAQMAGAEGEVASTWSNNFRAVYPHPPAV